MGIPATSASPPAAFAALKTANMQDAWQAPATARTAAASSRAALLPGHSAEVPMAVEPAMAFANDLFQLQNIGFFRVPRGVQANAPQYA